MKQRLIHIIQYLRAQLTPQWLLVSVVLGLLFALVVALIPNYSILFTALTSPKLSFFPLLLALTHGIFTSMLLYGAALLLIGFLTGVNVVLIARRSLRLRQAGATGVGSLFGALLGGCSACATGILPLLGLGGVFATLPFHGTEFAILAIIVLLATVYWNAYAEVCQVT